MGNSYVDEKAAAALDELEPISNAMNVSTEISGIMKAPTACAR